MFLVADVGNTLVKVAVFEDNRAVRLDVSPEVSGQQITNLVKGCNIEAAIISSVRKEDRIKEILSGFGFPVYCMDRNLPVPLINLYNSPETLGMDRLSAAAGAASLYPGKNILVVCAGTCLTFDYVNMKNEYLGGSISPGLNMRIKAMHKFTGRLPLETPTTEQLPLTGSNTREAILSGVINGMAAEIKGISDIYRDKYQDLIVVLSGGDLIYFDKMLKNRIFAIENIVLYGLNKILDYNVQKPD